MHSDSSDGFSRDSLFLVNMDPCTPIWLSSLPKSEYCALGLAPLPAPPPIAGLNYPDWIGGSATHVLSYV